MATIHLHQTTEGSNGVWKRLHYDWSNLRRITMLATTVVEARNYQPGQVQS